MGPERKSAVIEEKNRKLVAYHEGGHAIVAFYTKGEMRGRGEGGGGEGERVRERVRERGSM